LSAQATLPLNQEDDMAFSLHAVTVGAYIQTLEAVGGLINKAEGFCNEKRMAPPELIQARLAEDMLPFAYQVKSAAVHSLGAIEAVRRGVFSPDMTTPPDTFAALRARVSETLAGLQAFEPAEVDGFVGREMCFAMGERRMDFLAEDFLLTFSQPNFYFHATTAYDILRMKGVPLGKRDFMGPLRLRK
jgi:hypothetical protein